MGGLGKWTRDYKSCSVKHHVGYTLDEIKLGIEDAFSKGVEYMYDDVSWYDHAGNLICKSKMGLVGYYLDFKGYTTYKEL